jgi:hypothetical protein
MLAACEAQGSYTADANNWIDTPERNNAKRLLVLYEAFQRDK